MSIPTRQLRLSAANAVGVLRSLPAILRGIAVEDITDGGTTPGDDGTGCGGDSNNNENEEGESMEF